jgi:hypothetical protein
MAWCVIKDVTALPVILPLFIYRKSEEDIYAYFRANEVKFNQIYEVRATYR